jgi:hypothetical protein
MTIIQKGRIVAEFQPQAWKNDYAIDIDGLLEVDVTDRVLGMPLPVLQAIEDYRDSSDALCREQAEAHGGPFGVRVESAIQAFFGVEALEDVSQGRLTAKRSEHGVAAGPDEPVFILSDTRFDPPVTVRAEFGEYVHGGGVGVTLCVHGKQGDAMDGDAWLTATINQDSEPLDEDEVLVKTYGPECHGLDALLVSAGLVEGQPLRYARVGHATAPVYRLSQPAIAAARAEIEASAHKRTFAPSPRP